MQIPSVELIAQAYKMSFMLKKTYQPFEGCELVLNCNFDLK